MGAGHPARPGSANPGLGSAALPRSMAPMPPNPSPEPLAIVAVEGRAGLDRFIEVPCRIFASDPAWIQPLIVERRLHLSPGSNPYFQHARWQAWIALRGGRAVGRISAQIDALHLERYADATGFFGMLDAEDSAETFAALLGTAERWLRAQGMRRVRGPFSLSINEEMGLLVEGFATPPVFMMGHARPYYAGHVERLGYRKAVDTLAYMISSGFRSVSGDAAARRRIRASCAGEAARPQALRRRDFAVAGHIQRRLGGQLGVRAVHRRRIPRTRPQPALSRRLRN